MLAALGQQAVTHLSLPERMLQAEALLRRAGPPALLAQFEGEQPLRLLLEDYRQRAGLNFIGCFAGRYDVLRLLGTLSALEAREAREPALLEAPVEAPIFITGLPRSGTTFLFKLLAEDPENRSPAVWETMFPLPRGANDPPARRIATARRQLAAFDRMAPCFQAIHPTSAETPQECSEITSHIFRSFRFETTHHIPTYRSWLHAADHLPAYRFHRRFLQHLQGNDGRPRRWVVKCPDHVFTLEALNAIYPDARIIFLHRDPLAVLASVAGMTEVLRKPFNARIDRTAIGRQVTQDWLQGTDAMLRAEAEGLFPPERVLHLRFGDFTAQPLETVETIYRHFGLPLAEAARQRMSQRIAEEPRGGYGGVTFRLEDYGVDLPALRERFAGYRARFGV